MIPTASLTRPPALITLVPAPPLTKLTTAPALRVKVVGSKVALELTPALFTVIPWEPRLKVTLATVWLFVLAALPETMILPPPSMGMVKVRGNTGGGMATAGARMLPPRVTGAAGLSRLLMFTLVLFAKSIWKLAPPTSWTAVTPLSSDRVSVRPPTDRKSLVRPGLFARRESWPELTFKIPSLFTNGNNTEIFLPDPVFRAPTSNTDRPELTSRVSVPTSLARPMPKPPAVPVAVS